MNLDFLDIKFFKRKKGENFQGVQKMQEGLLSTYLLMFESSPTSIGGGKK